MLLSSSSAMLAKFLEAILGAGQWGPPIGGTKSAPQQCRKWPGLMLVPSDCPTSGLVFISEPFAAIAVKHFAQAQVT